MDIKEFAQKFLDNINVAVDMCNTDYDQELANVSGSAFIPCPLS